MQVSFDQATEIIHQGSDLSIAALCLLLYWLHFQLPLGSLTSFLCPAVPEERTVPSPELWFLMGTILLLREHLAMFAHISFIIPEWGDY